MDDLFFLVSLSAILLLAGGAVGIIGGLFGIGGGIITVPVLSTMFELLGADRDSAMHVAVATSLATILPLSITSLRTHAKHNAIDRGIVRHWGPMVAVGAVLGGIIAGSLDGRVLRLIFGSFVLMVTYRFWRPSPARATGDAMPKPWIQRVLAFAIGSSSAMLGVGGGVLGNAALNFCGVPLQRSIGTASTFGFMVAIPGLIVYLLSPSPIGFPYGTVGLLHPLALLFLTPGAILCAPIGARLTHRLPVTKLRAWFALFLLVLGGKMLISGLS